ncbi:rod shape-determining protein RodA [Candidatus Marinimicrobia bacterium]|nr:rod shape-determining protein RodA [Candidatus Neomarinimicrobiota bacterium]MDC0878405.1 FtsW/RodA/SpoVE family cell cycle protein [Candidatus Neomarinimicrobiota bacterium]|tara:strand:+ start:72 stop:1289 length:1218 start_codon:yes stop_codon:yes gene_type:complete
MILNQLLSSTTKDSVVRLFFIISGLIICSLVTLYSISDDPLSFNSSFYRQCIFLIFSSIVFFVIKNIPIKIIHDNSTLIFIGTLILCIIPFFLPRVEYTYRWIDLGFFYIQPSEYLKCATVIVVAKYLSNHQLEVKDNFVIIIPSLLTLLSASIVLNQPDLGTAVIIFAPLLPMLLWAGVRNFTIFLMIAPIITILAASNIISFTIWAFIMLCFFLTFQASIVTKSILYFAIIFTGLLTPFLWNNLADYQKQRILTFLNPDLDPMGSAYHIIQSITAIGSGGLFGKGWGAGSQTQLKFLPVQESDFILSVIAEEFGFFGISFVMLLCFLLIKTLLDIAFRSSDYFSSLVVVGLASILLSHIFINSAMTIGLMPVKGLPIPFISAGGSFLLSCFIMIGLVVNFSKN